MNKRIRELWQQAAESTAAYPSGQNNSWETQVNFMDKFAELIVIECAKVASDSVIDHSGHSETNICPKYLACHIKDHFGVQE